MSSKGVIVCVDDEMTVLDTLNTQLKNTFGGKYLIEIAESGEEGLEVLDELIEDGYEIKLIITDFLMPEMKGDEFLINVKKKEINAIKILLTGHAPEENIKRAFEEGGLDHHMAKPWLKEELETKLKSLI